jgi:hypothetical protein
MSRQTSPTVCIHKWVVKLAQKLLISLLVFTFLSSENDCDVQASGAMLMAHERIHCLGEVWPVNVFLTKSVDYDVPENSHE